MFTEEKWLQEPDSKEIERAMAELLSEAAANLDDDNLEGWGESEETPEKQKVRIIHPQSYYDNKAKKRKKRNKTASRSRKINRGK